MQSVLLSWRTDPSTDTDVPPPCVLAHSLSLDSLFHRLAACAGREPRRVAIAAGPVHVFLVLLPRPVAFLSGDVRFPHRWLTGVAWF